MNFEAKGSPATPDDRAWLTAEVEARALHQTKEQVRTTCSFARAERLFGREYHGRFVIEMLQNAADAWGADARSRETGSRVAVLITEGPALLVANQGAPMLASTVIESLGHIGASTKSEGEAIGHKGIGFKSVLEMTSTPEIYSGLGEDSPQLAVRFDPLAALDAIHELSPEWEVLLSEVGAPEPNDEMSAVPVLRYPQWVDYLPPAVEELGREGYDTVVRLPYTGPPEGKDDWLGAVRAGLADISDQIVLLLGCFSEVRIEDQIRGVSTLLVPDWDTVGEGLNHQAVTVRRNGCQSSRWIIYRRAMRDEAALAGEVAFGIRLSESTNHVVSASEPGPSAPFHLFFPTRISSGLPFLLHGYFSVDASRTGFYLGSRQQNEMILDGLAHLVADAVTDAVSGGLVEPSSLVNLLAECSTPEDPQALAFRDAVMNSLDEKSWIPATELRDQPSFVTPREAFVAEGAMSGHIERCFPAGYVFHRTGLRLPSTDLSDQALQLIASRQPSDHPSVWSAMEQLLRPGDAEIWDGEQADSGFLALLDLLDALRVDDAERASRLIASLSGDPTARLIPVAVGPDSRVLSPVPDPSSAVVGRRSQLVMARVRLGGPELPSPPVELGVSFLADGLLDSETQVDRAKRLGVRPFTVDNVLDRLNGIAATDVDPETLLSFVWSLLSRERVSAFSTRRCAERAFSFDPDAWFWCSPGRSIDETGRERQQRERHLAAMPLPARDGSWRPAGGLAFGADWAKWLAGLSGSPLERIDAYNALEDVSPGPHAMLASPEVLIPLLPEQATDADQLSETLPIDAERLGFLLRMGVWEVIPLEAFESRQRADRDPFPWTGDVEGARQEEVTRRGGWTFGLEGWGGERHRAVHIAEDYRFAWELTEAAERDASALARSLQHGLPLYGRRRFAQVFCAGCRDSGSGHAVMRTSRTEDGYPSWMTLQFRESRWVSAMVEGAPLARRSKPAEVWWRAKTPAGAALRQSPWRLVPTCGPETGISQELKRLGGISSIEDASIADVFRLLGWLRDRFEADDLPADPKLPGSARQAFIGIHRQAYERLADLVPAMQEGVRTEMQQVEVLCELGDDLVYVPVEDALHDDGRYSSYVRHFVGRVPFFVLPRDQESRAAKLGVAPFVVDLERRGTDQGVDVTEDLHALLSDRVAELMTIVVRHSLGTQTLDANSGQFETRANRLKSLSVRQVPNLIIDARIRDTDIGVTIGEDSDQDLFLEGATSSTPVLYHDLSGVDWQERIRRKLGPFLAALLENGAFAHTFALYLQQDSDAEREEFLLELGISAADVDQIAARVGSVSHEQIEARRRWVGVLSRLLASEDLAHDPHADHTTGWWTSLGLSADRAAFLDRALGTESARSDVSEEGPMRLLESAGVDLAELDRELRANGDQGLRARVAQRRFAQWMDANGRRVVAVMSSEDPAVAKAAVRELFPPQELEFCLDPDLAELLQPVEVLLASHGILLSSRDLAEDARATLAIAGGFHSTGELDARVTLLYDDEERARFTRERAAQWKRELRLLGVLSRMGVSETRASVRKLDAEVGGQLPPLPSCPTELAQAVLGIFSAQPTLCGALTAMLDDSVLSPPPDRDELLKLAHDQGIGIDRLPVLQRALDAPRRDQAREIQHRFGKLKAKGVTPVVPAGMAAPKAPAQGPEQHASSAPKRVAAVKVDEGHDRRKRELGHEGEQWALAAVIGNLVSLDSQQRNLALDAVEQMLNYFDGSPVEAALSHVDAARLGAGDDEDLVDELRGLLHVSQYSDGFGFDLVGWLAVCPGTEPIAMCIEVKNAGGTEFHLTLSEWKLAERLHREGLGDHYAVLVVQRGKHGGPPIRMDLLVDPLRLEREGKVSRDADGYAIRYGSR